MATPVCERLLGEISVGQQQADGIALSPQRRGYGVVTAGAVGLPGRRTSTRQRWSAGAGISQAISFIGAIHAAQKREGLWLAQHPFVQAVRNGSAAPLELERWVRQIYCTTRTYAEILLSLSPPPPVGLWMDPWRDLDQLLRLGNALGVSTRKMRASEPDLVVRGVQSWLRRDLTTPSRHVAAQICWALVEAMSPETGSCLAHGLGRHFGLKDAQLGYFRIGMKSRRGADRYAGTILRQIPVAEWAAIQAQTLLVTRLVVELYDSIGTSAQRPTCSARDTARIGRGRVESGPGC